MANLYAEISDEKGTTVHKIGARELVITLHVGSRDHSVMVCSVKLIYNKANATASVEIDGLRYLTVDTGSGKFVYERALVSRP